MSTLQVSASIPPTLSTAARQRPGFVLRTLRIIVAAMAETSRRKAEREIARAMRIHGLSLDDRA
jgi:hypothetical protein